RRAVHGRQHRRGPPLSRLPQARHPLTDEPRPRPGRDRSLMTAVVVGRETELETIEGFLADVGRGPAALVLSGEAGIGKTVLWETGVADARSRFGSVLSCRGVEAEASLS